MQEDTTQNMETVETINTKILLVSLFEKYGLWALDVLL